MVRIWTILIGITLLGLVLRLNNISPFKLYPDSYQSLLVAKNITDYHSVLGYLGTGGMLYPEFFSWSHPVYPLMILLISTVTHDMTWSASFLALSLGVMAIPLAYFFLSRVFSSSSYGLAGTLLLALSFNHTVWSGFIMTETTGIFFLLLFLACFFGNSKQKFRSRTDIISGILLAVAILTRYEYVIILFPITLYLFTEKQLVRLFTMISSFILILALFVWQLYPLPSTVYVIEDQLGSLVAKEGLLLLIFLMAIAGFLLVKQAVRNKLVLYGRVALVGFLWFLCGYLVLQDLFGTNQWMFFTSLAALRHFIIHDFLFAFLSLIGYTLLFNNSRTRSLGLFSLLSIVCLFVIYHRVNPDMERYMTHLIPFLLIPASYGLITVVKTIKNRYKTKLLIRSILLIPLILLVFLQILLTASGMKYSQDSSWYRTSYEDRSASLVKKYLHGKSQLLIASYPEPYYYALQVPTQSISDTYPYLFLDAVSQDQQLIIIEDMGMHDDFPNFTTFLNKNLQKNKIAIFRVDENFHYVDRVEKEIYPVVIYKITYKEFELMLRKLNK